MDDSSMQGRAMTLLCIDLAKASMTHKKLGKLHMSSESSQVQRCAENVASIRLIETHRCQQELCHRQMSTFDCMVQNRAVRTILHIHSLVGEMAVFDEKLDKLH